MLQHILTISIERAGAPGGIWYTERQLYYEVCRTLRPWPSTPAGRVGWALGAGAPLAAAALLRSPRTALLASAAGAAGAIGTLVSAPFTLRPPLSFARFQVALQRYRAAHGEPPGLLPASAPAPLPLTGREPDLGDYGLPRLLVCQHVAVAQMLLANRAHMEWGCAVWALGAAPLPEVVGSMLHRAAEARIYLLHDASAAGLRLASTPPAQLGLPSGIPTIVLGLRPAHARQIHLFAERGEQAETNTNTWPTYLSNRERTWLAAGWRAEVEALNPARLLRALRRNLLGETVPRFRLPSLQRERTTGFLTWPEQEV